MTTNQPRQVVERMRPRTYTGRFPTYFIYPLILLILVAVIVEARENLAGNRVQTADDESARLVKSLKSTDALVRAKAAYSLGKMGQRALPAVHALIDLLPDSHPLGWTPGTVAYLANTSPGLEAARALTALAERSVIIERVIPVLIKYFQRGGGYAVTAVEIIADLGPTAKQTLPMLLRTVHGPWSEDTLFDNTRLLEVSITAISKIAPADPLVLSDVIGVLQRNPFGVGPSGVQISRLGIQGSAIEAIGYIGPKAKSAVPFLMQALKARDGINRLPADGDSIWMDAAKALGNIGPDSRPAVPLLINGFSYDIVLVEETIHTALSKIIGNDLGIGLRPGVYIDRKWIKDKWLQWWQQNKSKFESGV